MPNKLIGYSRYTRGAIEGRRDAHKLEKKFRGVTITQGPHKGERSFMS